MGTASRLESSSIVKLATNIDFCHGDEDTAVSLLILLDYGGTLFPICT